MDHQVESYLRRINYSGPIEPTAGTLKALQVAHLRAVPFENLSIHNNEPITLDDAALLTKIVSNKRGGFCYELNGLFAFLLRSLGFKVDMLSANVANDEGEFGPDFDHMALMVTLEDRWLVDVGFGDSFIEPLRLDDSGEQIQGLNSYRIIDEGPHFTMTRKIAAGDWNAQYRFKLQPYEYTDYQAMCEFHQTSPESHFTRKQICSLATEDGRITLSEMKLITTSLAQQVRQERVLTTKEEYNETLRSHFGIVLDKN
jgi:N-hydroxyarylamine O-acetyltransferase